MTRTYHYEADLVRVIDGDTVVLVIDLGFHVSVTQTVRLSGIDTPERGQPGFHEATQRLQELLSQQLELGPLEIQTERTVHGDDKQGAYGRYLAWIWGRDQDSKFSFSRSFGSTVNWQMIDEGLAVPYVKGIDRDAWQRYIP